LSSVGVGSGLRGVESRVSRTSATVPPSICRTPNRNASRADLW